MLQQKNFWKQLSEPGFGRIKMIIWKIIYFLKIPLNLINHGSENS